MYEKPITKNMYQALCTLADNNLKVIVDIGENKNKVVVMIEHPSDKIIDAVVRIAGNPERYYQGLRYAILYYTVEV